MADQGQAVYGIPVVPGTLSHFWQPTTAAYTKISIIYNRGPDYGQEDVVWHAWGEICDLYFPKVAASPTGPRWSIDGEAYRGYPPVNPSQIKPDLIAVKLISTQTPPNQPPQSLSKDFLWIKCKAASEDKPHGWKNVLNEATTRLQIAHSTRVVFLVIAIGWKCMFFMWDPISPATQTQLSVRPADNGQPWMIDPRIKVVVPGPWVAPTGEINSSDAMTLECFSFEQVNGQNELCNRENLGTIETILVRVQNTALQGYNPEQF